MSKLHNSDDKVILHMYSQTDNNTMFYELKNKIV